MQQVEFIQTVMCLYCHILYYYSQQLHYLEEISDEMYSRLHCQFASCDRSGLS